MGSPARKAVPVIWMTSPALAIVGDTTTVAGGAVTVNGALALAPLVSPYALKVFCPRPRLAGTLKVCVKAPVLSAVALNGSTPSKVRSTFAPGAKLLPMTDTLVCGTPLDGLAVSAG